MSILIGLLTVVLVLNALLLILLVLIQLPKKEAGAGMAFGGSATDALFGAGSGNVLTKVTKYGVVVFICVTLVLAILQNNYYHRSSTGAFESSVAQESGKLPAPQTPPVTQPSAETPVVIPSATNASGTGAPGTIVSTNTP